MKKISILILLLSAAVTIQAAKVGFILPNVEKNAGSIDVYEEALPWDAYWDGANNHEQSPERKAYEWFNGTYSATKSFYTIYDVEQGSLLSDGKPVVDVLWINIDRSGSFDQVYTNLITRSDFKTALSNYVKAGGNVLLTKQAVRLVFEIDRISGEGALPSCNTAGYDASSVENYGFQEMNGSSLFKVCDGLSFTMYKTSLSTTSYTANRDCSWNLSGEGKVFAFESTHGCKTLGMDASVFEGKTGFVEFYPSGDYKGTILAMGLNSYEWGADNTLKSNVERLTQNMLDYLSVKPTDASVNWQGWETAASGYIGGSMDAATAPTAGDHIASVSAASYTSSDANVASVNASTGAIDYNYFGSATVTSTVTVAGDGQWVPKNVAEVSKDKSVTVSGGSSSATIGYVLTAEQGLNRLSEEDTGIENPDLTTAKWFYTNYVATGAGQFVNPANAIPAAVKVLWIHSDRVGLSSEDYYTHLGGNTFRDKLTSYKDAGGNVFVSKQATRLVGDLGRNGYPSYNNGGYGDEAAWRIGNRWNLSGTEINHSDHAVYKNMGTSTTISAAGRHTNNNCVWQNFDANYNQDNPQRLVQYETDHNCRVLGGWGHGDSEGVNDQLECVGFAEFYPQPSTTQGTIIAMGLAAYHWANPTTAIQTLTSNILSYLSITEVPAFNWVVEPQDDMVSNTQRVQIEFVRAQLDWTVSDPSIVDVEVDPDHTSDTDYKILRFKAPGDVTITATRSADGYNIPLNVTTPTTVTKTISVVTNIYTRDVSAIPNYYGTICLPRAAASYEGATMFRLVDKTATNGIIIEEVDAMAAGVPYIFYPTGDEVRVTMTGNTADVQPANGLVGRLTAVTLESNDNHYILAYNKIWQVDESIDVPANRAYIDMSAINAISPAPGRKRYVINSTGGTTALEEIEVNNTQNAKVLRNGILYIIKNGVQYNAQGQMIH